jgi:hypothetical protein
MKARRHTRAKGMDTHARSNATSCSPAFVHSCLFLCLLTGAAHAQQREIIIRDGNVQIIEGRSVQGRQAYPDDPIPPDEELASVEIEPLVLAIVERLDAPEYEEREAATRELLTMDLDDNSQLYAVLSRKRLSPEQRMRLVAAVQDRVLYASRGALGIQMQSPDGLAGEQGGVVVSDLIPGLPAERVLKVGDRIIAIEGRRVADSTDLVRVVQSRRPGDEVLLAVVRPRRDEAGRIVHDANGRAASDELELRMPLGSTERLYQPGRATLGRPMNPLEQERRVEVGWIERRFALQPTLLTIRQR